MSISFDGTDILTTAYIPQFVKHETVADRLLNSVPLGREDGNVIVSSRYGQKIIRIQGTLRAATQASLDDAIDAFKELLSRPEKNLDISWSTAGTRRYVATCTRHEFDRDHYHTNAVPWTAEFVVASGIGVDTSATTPINNSSIATTLQGDGSYAYTGSFTMSGSKPAAPVITLEITTADAAMLGVEFLNTDNDERILITANGDWDDTTLIIDCENKTVMHDIDGTSVEVPFYGVFPTFQIGTNNFKITTGGFVNQQSSKQTLSDPESGAINFASTNTRFGQSFTVPTSDETFQGFRFGLSRATSGGSPGGNFFCLVKPDDGTGKPDMGASSILSVSIAHTLVNGLPNYEYVLGSSGGPATLEANTRYWMVIGSAGATGSEYYFAALPTDNTYARSSTPQLSTDAGSTFNDTTGVLAFQVLFGGLPKATNIDLTIAYPKTYL